MDSKLQKKFSTLIDEHLKSLSKDIENLNELVKPVKPDNAIGRLSRMEALNELSVNKANLDKALKRQEQLLKAQQRVQSDDYGYCLRCEEEIQEKRLEVLPESQICMSCLNKKQPD